MSGFDFTIGFITGCAVTIFLGCTWDFWQRAFDTFWNKWRTPR